MSHLSGELERSLGETYLNGDVSITNNLVAYALGITQATNSGYLYVSLHTGAPNSDTVGTEVTTTAYPGYTRAAVRREKSFGSSTSKWTWNSGVFENLEAINFPICGTGATGTITNWGIYDAATGGNLLFHGPLVASGASFKVGYHTGEDDTGSADLRFVFSRAHGLSNSDTIRMYQLYDGALGSSSSATGATNGVQATVSGVATDNFDISYDFTTSGGFLFVKSSSISLAAGKIPAIPASGMILRFA